jgi:hypothetical protein
VNEELYQKAAEYVKRKRCSEGNAKNISDGFLQVGQQYVASKLHNGTWIPMQGVRRNDTEMAP